VCRQAGVQGRYYCAGFVFEAILLCWLRICFVFAYYCAGFVFARFVFAYYCAGFVFASCWLHTTESRSQVGHNTRVAPATVLSMAQVGRAGR
jgi:apolipoprotein N-acyltransferase